MESLIILIPLSIIAVGVAVLIFYFMSESGQFDDTEGAAWRVLLDDDSTVGLDPNSPPPVAGEAKCKTFDLDQNADQSDR